MKIVIETKVEQSVADVKQKFDKDLFLALSPPFPPVKLLRFDGSKKGDEVGLELNFLLFKQRWISDITADEDGGDEYFYFIDEGKELPFFLEKWHHKHHIYRAEGGGAIIRDEITFKAPYGLSFLFYPALWSQFLYRVPIYKKYFKVKDVAKR
ncbi:MAG: hypothetical protein LAT68_01470 [Cyclobacteriaceae bacterium]|nr:hypothetical protein [Cyclobacteriaceae bacterium]MCH8514972.1 hypothetical protein [Cyclobacteriaceae bacterium]